MRKGRWQVTTAIALLGALALTGCTASGKKDASSPSSSSSSGTASASTSSSPTKEAAPLSVISVAPAAGAANLSPTVPIKASVANGTLSTVSLVNAEGVVVKGALAANKTSWTAAEPLGYGKSYTLTATSKNADGVVARKVSTFTTVSPANLTMPYIDTTGGADITNGGTYGVGMVINVHWDESITDRAAAEKAVQITTTPAVKGAWYWANDKEAHWRPAAYWKTGTKVTVAANAYGVEVGPGLYGQADASTSFKIGESHISIADDVTHQVQVFVAGKLSRTMPTSMGRGGYVKGSNGDVSLYTPSIISMGV